MREAIEGIHIKELNKPGAGRPGIALKSQRCTLGCSTRNTAPPAPLNKPQNTPWSILGRVPHGTLLVLPQCTAQNIRLGIFGWAPRSKHCSTSLALQTSENSKAHCWNGSSRQTSLGVPLHSSENSIEHSSANSSKHSC